jgi:cell division protein FtsL
MDALTDKVRGVLSQDLYSGDALNVWRTLVILMCASAVVMATVCLVRVAKRSRLGDRRVCVPIRVMVGTLVSLIVASTGGAVQLLYWTHYGMPFSWYHSPLVFAVAFAVCATLMSLINFVYPTRGTIADRRDDEKERP